MAVVIILEHKITSWVPDLLKFVRVYTPEVVEQLYPEVVNLFHVLNNPVAHTFGCGFGNLIFAWRCVQTRI